MYSYGNFDGPTLFVMLIALFFVVMWLLVCIAIMQTEGHLKRLARTQQDCLQAQQRIAEQLARANELRE